MRFRVKITGRIPFFAPINLTPVDVSTEGLVALLGKHEVDAVSVWLNSLPSGSAKIGPYRLSVRAVIEPKG